MTGEEADVKAAIRMVEDDIKGEPPLALKKRRCATCFAPPPAFTAGSADHGGTSASDATDVALEQKQCIFSGVAEADLPDWFQKRDQAAE